MRIPARGIGGSRAAAAQTVVPTLAFAGQEPMTGNPPATMRRNAMPAQRKAMTAFYFTYLIGALYLINAAWLIWHGQWVFGFYWLSAFAITVCSFLMASGKASP